MTAKIQFKIFANKGQETDNIMSTYRKVKDTFVNFYFKCFSSARAISEAEMKRTGLMAKTIFSPYWEYSLKEMFYNYKSKNIWRRRNQNIESRIYLSKRSVWIREDAIHFPQIFDIEPFMLSSKQLHMINNYSIGTATIENLSNNKVLVIIDLE